jgi:predicted RNA binding protein YcfA (HicA-like mRNA interferase family)
MNAKQAIKLLESKGWIKYRMGKGDHLIMTKGNLRIIVPVGSSQISPGMIGKVKSATRK